MCPVFQLLPKFLICSVILFGRKIAASPDKQHGFKDKVMCLLCCLSRPPRTVVSFRNVTHPCFVFFRGSDGSSSTPSLKKNASVSSDMSDLASQVSGNPGELFLVHLYSPFSV